MNPFGPPVAFPVGPSNGHQDAGDKPHVTSIIHGTWNVVYSWPPGPLTPQPPRLALGAPSKLEAVLFGCRCREELADKLQPIKVHSEDKVSVQACELVDDENNVAEALDRTTCDCRTTPLGDKFVALPINEDILLHYQRHDNVNYTFSQPNTCLLLFKHLPSSLEMEEAVSGMAIARRNGDVTFMIKQE